MQMRVLLGCLLFVCSIVPMQSIAKSIPTTAPSLQFPQGKVAFSLITLTPESVGRRKTLVTEVVKDKIYTLDQVQGIINVNVPVRSTIIALRDGLFINNPVAPTDECVEIVKNIENKLKKKVKYIVLSSVALEHKGTSIFFSKKFPDAEVYVQPEQFSFPINLPTNFYFPFGKNIKIIPESHLMAPWGDEIEHEILTVKPSSIGTYAETAFFHKSTQSLLVTDIIVKVGDAPDTIIDDDPRALLYHARDNILEEIDDTPSNRLKGWRRMVLFALTFNPSGITVSSFPAVLKDLGKVSPAMRLLGAGLPFSSALYPWAWTQSEIPNFNSFKGYLLVAPILRELLLNRQPEVVLDWVAKVSRWNFKRVIPCHFENNVKATNREFYEAFNFLRGAKEKKIPNPDDCSLLSRASVLLQNLGVLYPVKVVKTK